MHGVGLDVQMHLHLLGVKKKRDSRCDSNQSISAKRGIEQRMGAVRVNKDAQRPRRCPFTLYKKFPHSSSGESKRRWQQLPVLAKRAWQQWPLVLCVCPNP